MAAPASVKWLAVILLVGVFVRHDTAYTLADMTGFNPKAIFYVLGGWWEAILAAIILQFVRQRPERNVYWHLSIFACLVTICESLQMTCQLFTGSTTGNVCDNLSRLPIGATMTALYVLFACWRWPGQPPVAVLTLVAGGELFFLTNSIAVTIGVIAAGYALWRLKSG